MNKKEELFNPMPGLGEKLYNPKKYGRIRVVSDIISPNVQGATVQQYRKGHQTYTFIVKKIQGFLKIIYIQNLKKDFFSNENVYDINYIKSLNVEFVKKFTKKERSKINLCEKTLQTKSI